MRWNAICCVALAVGVLDAGSAAAATRYVSPTSTTTSGSCATPQTACTAGWGVGQAASGDTVLIAPGQYNGGFDVPAGVTAEGSDPANPPQFTGETASSQLVSLNAGSTLRRVVVLQQGDFGIYGFAAGITIEDVRVSAPSWAIIAGGDGMRILDTVAHSSGNPAIDLAYSGTPSTRQTIAVRNVTAVSDAGPGLEADSGGGPLTVSVENSILAGGSGQHGIAAPDGASVSAGHSYLDSSPATSYTDLGGNLTSAPVFAGAASGDFRETSASPTVDAGTADASLGAADPDGRPRTLGPAPDIGAYELPEAPQATTGVASSVGTSTATLGGTLNAEGLAATAQFDFGTSPTALDEHVTASPGSATDAADPVSATLSGLASGTTFYFRLEATNAAGTTQASGIGSFRTAVPGVSSSPPPPAARLALSHVAQSHSRWRRSKAPKHTPRRLQVAVGTRFSFTLNRAAPVSLSFTLLQPGRVSHGRCRLTKSRSGRRCTLATLRGAMLVSGHAGANRVSFTGRTSRRARPLPVGSYRVSFSAPFATGSPKALSFSILA